VLSGGAKGGVTCFSVDPSHGLVNQQILDFDSTFNQTDPPKGPPNTASEIIFKPDSSALIGLTKGNPGASPAQPGAIIVWPVENGGVSQKPIIDHVSDIILEFGSVWVSNNDLFISDPSFGAAIVSVTGTSVTEKAHIDIAGQSAICWAMYSEQNGKAYAIDAGKNVITIVDVASGQISGNITISLPQTANKPGLFDSIIIGETMYSLAAVSGIVVIDLAQDKAVNFIDLNGLGSRQGWTGMAAYTASQ